MENIDMKECKNRRCIIQSKTQFPSKRKPTPLRDDESYYPRAISVSIMTFLPFIKKYKIGQVENPFNSLTDDQV